MLRIQENWPRISEAATVITSLEDKLPVIHQAVARVQELDQNFDKVANAITLGTEKASQAIEIVSAAQNALPKIADLAEKGTAVADQVNDFLTTHDGAFETIAPVLKQNLVLAQQAADAVTTLTDRLLQINLSHLPTADEVNAVKDRLVGVEKVLARTSSLLDRLNSYIPGQPLTNQLERLKAIQQKVTRQIDILGAIADALAAGKT